MSELTPADENLILTAFERKITDWLDEDEAWLANLDAEIAKNNWETQ